MLGVLWRLLLVFCVGFIGTLLVNWTLWLLTTILQVGGNQ